MRTHFEPGGRGGVRALGPDRPQVGDRGRVAWRPNTRCVMRAIRDGGQSMCCCMRYEATTRGDQGHHDGGQSIICRPDRPRSRVDGLGCVLGRRLSAEGLSNGEAAARTALRLACGRGGGGRRGARRCERRCERRRRRRAAESGVCRRSGRAGGAGAGGWRGTLISWPAWYSQTLFLESTVKCCSPR